MHRIQLTIFQIQHCFRHNYLYWIDYNILRPNKNYYQFCTNEQSKQYFHVIPFLKNLFHSPK